MRRFGMLALATLSFLLLGGSDCGHGGGSPCPTRATAADGPDAGTAADPYDDPDFDPEADPEGNAAVGTGGGEGGRTDCPQR